MLTAAVLSELQKLPQQQRQGLQRLRGLVCTERSLASLSTLASQMQRIGETASLTLTENCSSDISIFVAQFTSILADVQKIQFELDKQTHSTILEIEKEAKNLIPAPDGYSWTRQ